MKKQICFLVLTTLTTATFAGEVTGSADQHTADSIAQGTAKAEVALPASVTASGKVYVGSFAELPAFESGNVPTVVFLHGSSGINPKLGYDKWQKWLAEQGIASFMFDGMQLADRIKYSSPVDKAVYEQVHRLRGSEIDIALDVLKDASWADPSQLILAGTSEGAVSVARYDGDAFIGKIIYSWSCEDNYFVEAHQTSQKSIPVLNIMSAKDKYFSDKNDYLGLDDAKGHCGDAFGEEQPDNVEVVLIPDAPHTLFNLPAAQSATLGFIEKILN